MVRYSRSEISYEAAKARKQPALPSPLWRDESKEHGEAREFRWAPDCWGDVVVEASHETAATDVAVVHKREPAALGAEPSLSFPLTFGRDSPAATVSVITGGADALVILIRSHAGILQHLMTVVVKPIDRITYTWLVRDVIVQCVTMQYIVHGILCCIVIHCRYTLSVHCLDQMERLIQNVTPPIVA